jgi:nucleoside-triphosphatase
LDGRRAILAHVNLRGPKKVGKYGVNLATLDTLATTSIQQAVNLRKIVVIDEIGPMEILSKRFRDVVMRTLQSEATVLGAIVKRSTPFTDQIKTSPGVTLLSQSR